MCVLSRKVDRVRNATRRARTAVLLVACLLLAVGAMAAPTAMASAGGPVARAVLFYPRADTAAT